MTAILVNPASGPTNSYRTEVSDRYEVGFDWNPTEMAMVGKPVIKNCSSALPKGTPGGSMFGQACPQPKIDGAYDHVEVVPAKTDGKTMTLVDEPNGWKYTYTLRIVK